MVIKRQAETGFLQRSQASDAVREFFSKNDCTGKRILLIIPDNTRSGPIGQIFRSIFDSLEKRAEAIDVLIALGTHKPMTGEEICSRLDISPGERKTRYSSVRFFNHEWHKPEVFLSIGRISKEEICRLSGDLFCEEVDVAINKRIFDYDELYIIGPVFPHEVVGFSGGHKYIFPGIAGAEIINFFHWLGAVITNPLISGKKWTPTRKVVEKAASFLRIPRKLFALVSQGERLKGIFIGECLEAWEEAAALSQEVHIVLKDKPYKTVIGIAPLRYDDLWTAGKVMYKLEPIVADGGTLIIYAPHIREISHTHGKMIRRVGYHTRDYFLKQMDRFSAIPRCVLAHSTHVKGAGSFRNGIEKPRIHVVLATKIGKEACREVNLEYKNPDELHIGEFENREEEGILVIPHAGEVLYRLSSGHLPSIPKG